MKLVYKVSLAASMGLLTVDCSYRFNDSRSYDNHEDAMYVTRKSNDVKNVSNSNIEDMRQYSNDHIQLQLN